MSEYFNLHEILQVSEVQKGIEKLKKLSFHNTTLLYYKYYNLEKKI